MLNLKTKIKMKKSKEIKTFILKKGNKLTNAEMVTKLGVPTMTFAGVLAAMKRKGEVPSNFLKTDVIKSNKSSKSTTTKTVANSKTSTVSNLEGCGNCTSLSVNYSKVAIIKKSDLTPQLHNRLNENSNTLIEGKSFYNANTFKSAVNVKSKKLTEKSLNVIKGLDRVFSNCDYIELI